jgi:hypothetical protein
MAELSLIQAWGYLTGDSAGAHQDVDLTAHQISVQDFHPYFVVKE